MVYGMDRIEQLTEAVKKDIVALFIANSERMLRDMPQQIEGICKDLSDALYEVLGNALVLQQNNMIGAIKYITFSIMQSDVLLRERKIQINVYDEQFYLSEVQAVSNWKCGVFFRHLDEGFSEVENILKKTFTRVQKYELKQIRQAHETLYYLFAIGILRILLPVTLVQIHIDDLSLSPAVLVTTGLYMEKQINVFTWENKE